MVSTDSYASSYHSHFSLIFPCVKIECSKFIKWLILQSGCFWQPFSRFQTMIISYQPIFGRVNLDFEEYPFLLISVVCLSDSRKKKRDFCLVMGGSASSIFQIENLTNGWKNRIHQTLSIPCIKYCSIYLKLVVSLSPIYLRQTLHVCERRKPLFLAGVMRFSTLLTRTNENTRWQMALLRSYIII
jgi:hypothetical protein